jgi:cytochrome c556
MCRYTAVRADLEKAELERDALLDALRETRSTLGDVRRQRDSLDAEVKRERGLMRLVKKVRLFP